MPVRETRVSSTCPVCSGIAGSPHHIKPVSAGGTNSPKNKVMLCRGCHDIVEDIYDREGIEYSPSLAQYIRLRYDLAPITEFFWGKSARRSPKHDMRYSSDSIELCVCCYDKFRQRNLDDRLCPRCKLRFGCYSRFVKAEMLYRVKMLRQRLVAW